MGKANSKIQDANANVINNVEIVDHTEELNSIWMLTLILVIVSVTNLLLKVYILHKRSLIKRYLSKANDLDKV